MSTAEHAPALAFIRSDNRRGAVAEALALLESDLVAALERAGGRARVVLGKATIPEVVAAVVDALLSLGGEVAIETDAKRRPALEAELWKRPVELAESAGGECLAVVMADARGRGADRASKGDLVIAEGRTGWSRRRVVAVAGFDPSLVGSALAGTIPAGARCLGDPITGRPSTPSPHFAGRAARARREA
jgi:hypothetical protein